jgi:hypothetical protein
MAKSKRKTPIPQKMSIDEASVFWDEHSLFEFDGTEEVDVVFKLPRKQYVGIDQDIFEKIRSKARQKNMTPEALLEAWIAEKIQTTS